MRFVVYALDSNAITFLSKEWLINTSIAVVFILSVLYLGKLLPKEKKKYVTYVLGSILILTNIIGPLRYLILDRWTIQENLPLHLCGISGLICCVFPFIKHKNKLFDFVYYTGVIGGFMALWTPQMNAYDNSFYAYFAYYLNHVCIMTLPLYMIRHTEIKLSKYSWLKTFLYLNILMSVIMPINFTIGSNYMYLATPPAVNNPLIIGEWPYYLVWFELFVLLLVFGIYKLSVKTK